MELKNSVKNQVNKKIKKVIFKIIKPYIPFILTILGIIFAICTVADALFTTDEDMQIFEKLNSENYEAQYMEWVKEKELAPNAVMEGIELGARRNICVANTRIYNNYFTVWNESSSYNSENINYILEQI